MNNRAILGTTISLLISAACGEVKSINRSQGQSVSAEQQSDPNFELAGLGDASCQLTYQLVKKVTGMSSASVFYEADSGNLVSRQAGLQTDFGDGCFTYCSAEFQSLKTRYGAERVLLRNCNFVRNIASASVKGLIETFADGTVKGFACKYGQEASVDVEVFLGGASGVGVFAGRTTANLAPANDTDRQNLAKQCATAAAVHRFSFAIPEALRTQNPGKAIFVHAIDAAASNKNFAIGDSGKFMLAGLPPKSCPAGYVLVPASNISGLGNPSAKAGHPDWWLDTSKDFCVMKYPAKNVGGLAKSVPEGLPWVNIPRGLTEATAGSALKACKDIGAGYRLISNTQWQTVARNAENVASNWSGGAVGIGVLNRGHSDGSPYAALANTADDTNGYFGTGNTGFTSASWSQLGASPAKGAEQKRTHTLSNGNVVWDFSGNIWQWLSDDGSTLGMSLVNDWEYTSSTFAEVSAVNRLNFGPRGPYGSSKNAGTFWGSYQGGAVIRGGGVPDTGAGLFTGGLSSSPTESGSGIGLRCAFLP